MRSLVLVEVEHGETLDTLNDFLKVVHNVPVLMTSEVRIINYGVRVDVPLYLTAQYAEDTIGRL